MTLAVGADDTIAYPTTADYYVDGSVGSSGVGTSLATAFKTVQEAVNAIHTAGGNKTCAIKAGTYREKVSSTGKDFGASGSYFYRYGTDEVIISGANALTGWTACDVGDATLLGAGWVNCYKTTIASSSLHAGQGINDANLYEAGVQMVQPYLAAEAMDQRFLYDQNKYLVATSNFGLTGGFITSITDTSTFNLYGDDEVANAHVYIYYDPNHASPFPIDSYDGTNTITVTTGETPQASPNNDRYAIVNLLSRLVPGGWGYNKTASGGNYTVYCYPANAANLTSEIEFSCRNCCWDIGAAPASTEYNLRIEGIKFFQSAGSENANGICFGNASSGVVSIRRSGITLRHNTFGKCWFTDSGYGAVYITSTNETIVERNTILDCSNAIGVFFSSHANSRFTRNSVSGTARSPFSAYGGNNGKPITGATNANPVVLTVTGHLRATGDVQWINKNSGNTGMTQIYERQFTITVIDANTFSLDGEDGTAYGSYASGATSQYLSGDPKGHWTTLLEVSHNVFDNCAWTAHANLGTYYEGCDHILIYGNQWTNCGLGYFTFQETSNIYFGFNSLGSGNSAIVDQNHTSDGEPDALTPVGYFWNNKCLPNKDTLTTTTNVDLGTVNSPRFLFYFYNNICHGGGVNLVAVPTQLADQECNFFTGFYPWSSPDQNASHLAATDEYDLTLANTYVSAATGDFSYVPGSVPTTKQGFNMSTVITNVLQPLFPTFDFSVDMNGDPVTWSDAFIGPYDPNGSITGTFFGLQF